MTFECNSCEAVNIQGFNGSIGSDFLLEGIPIGKIAGDTTLSRDDVLSYFSLPRDLYTDLHHEKLMSEMTSGRKTSFSFQDITQYMDHTQGRKFIRSTDLASATRCELATKGVSLEDPLFDTFIQTRAYQNAMIVEKGGAYLAEEYYPKYDNTRGLNYIEALTHDIDRVRVRNVKAYFTKHDCADIDRDEQCIVDLNCSSSCESLASDAECFEKVQYAAGREIADASAIGGDPKVEAKINLTTLASRTGAVVEALKENRKLFPSHANKILEVGIGLEIVNPYFWYKAGSQVYEPFGIIYFALNILETDLQDLEVTTADISQIPMQHIWSAVKNASEDKPYTVYLEPKEGVDYYSHFDYLLDLHGASSREFSSIRNRITLRVEIPQEIVRVLHPVRADIVTDRIAEAESYDIVVMLNVLHYLGWEEKRLALDNVARLLKKGGILVTDGVGDACGDDCDNPLVSSSACQGLSIHGLKHLSDTIILHNRPEDSFTYERTFSFLKKMP